MRGKLPPLRRAKLKLRLASAALAGALASGGKIRAGLINLASAFVAEATHELREAQQDTPGASGTAREAPGAVSSDTASRHLVRAPQLAEAG